jgi:hypothetical protein
MSTDALAPTETETVANPTGQVTEQATAAESQVNEEGQAKEERFFSQDEVDAFLKKRLAKESRRTERKIAEEVAKAKQSQQPSQPSRGEFATDEEHQRASFDHAVTEKAKELARKEIAELKEREQFEKSSSTFWEKADDLAERFPDFDSVVTDPGLPLNGPILEFVMDSDIGPELAYHLGKHKGEAMKLARMSPVKAVMRLLEIQNEIKSKPKARISSAPEPMQPVGNRGRATASALPSDSDDMETWAAKERARTAKLRSS